MTGFAIRPATAGDADHISALIVEEFRRSVSADFETAGRRAFLSYAESRALTERLARKEIEGFVGVDDEAQITGYIEANSNHISLFFVTRQYQRRGLGKALVEGVLLARPGARITVHAAPRAKPIYERLGFQAAGDWTTRDGILFFPMFRASEDEIS